MSGGFCPSDPICREFVTEQLPRGRFELRPWGAPPSPSPEDRAASPAFPEIGRGSVPSKGVLIMCDYSLHMVSSRPAEVGEKLVLRRFLGGTRGFAAVNEPYVA